MAAPRHSWPLGRGFDRWYGFHGGETHQFVPVALPRQPLGGPTPVDRGGLPPERRSGRPGHRPAGRPPGRGRGPSLLPLLLHRRLPLPPPRPPGVDRPVPGPLRPGLGPLARGDLRPAARAGPAATGHRAVTPSAVGAGLGRPAPTRSSGWRPGSWSASPPTSSYTDAQLARLLDFLEQTGDREDTLVILVSDNGASSEGGPTGSINDNRLQNFDPAGPEELARRIDELGGPRAHNNYPWGWTMAGNTPFRRWKREVHEGGVADPCIVSWPAGIAAGGGVRRQFAHATDILPTVLELAGIETPEHHRVRAPDPASTGSASPPCSVPTGPRRPAHRDHPVLRDVRKPGHLPRRLEGGDLQAHRTPLRRRPQLERALRRGPLGAVPRGRGPDRDPRPGRRRARPAGRHGRAVVGRGPGATRSSPSTTGSSTPWSTPSPTGEPRD